MFNQIGILMDQKTIWIDILLWALEWGIRNMSILNIIEVISSLLNFLNMINASAFEHSFSSITQWYDN